MEVMEPITKQIYRTKKHGRMRREPNFQNEYCS